MSLEDNEYPNGGMLLFDEYKFLSSLCVKKPFSFDVPSFFDSPVWGVSPLLCGGSKSQHTDFISKIKSLFLQNLIEGYFKP